jgi:excisionase family DNA binding protein
MAKTTTEKVGELDLLTTKEVATILKIAPSTLMLLVNGGQVTASRIGGQWRFERREIVDFFVRSKTKQRRHRVGREAAAGEVN